MIDGPNDTHSISENVVPLSLFRFERMLQGELDQKVEGAHINVRLLDNGDPSALPSDPRFLTDVVDQVIDALEESNEPIPNCDFLRASLHCHDCGAVTHDELSDCETYVAIEGAEREIEIGSELKVDIDSIGSDFYLKVNPLEPGTALRILEGWWCARCSNVNWAEIVVVDDVVRSIWSVAINKPLLNRIHLISSEVVEFAAQKCDRPAWSLSHEEILQILHR
jgi:hypothetical protein